MKRVIIIPARLTSTRLPRKVLLDLRGKTVIQRVYEQCVKVKNCDVFIATDDVEVKEICSSFTKNVIMTSVEHESGTDRIAEAVSDLECDVVVNVQGDEPFINHNLITELFNVFEKSTDIKMSSVMEDIIDNEDINNPNVVKVVVDKNKNALYFSRSAVPFIRDEKDKANLLSKSVFFKHVGIYGYRRDFLLEYSKIPKSILENLEKLEQLRVLENGYKIRMIKTSYESLGIDTIEDYNKALQIIDES